MALIVLTILATAGYIYVVELRDITRLVLESEITPVVVWLYVGVVLFAHYIFNRELSAENGALVITQFNWFADMVLNTATLGVVATTALTLLKGVYIQKFFGDKMYFNEFSSLDIWSMLGVCVFLLGYVVVNVFKLLKDLLIYSKAEEVTPE
jgi:hypothetical protein